MFFGLLSRRARTKAHANHKYFKNLCWSYCWSIHVLNNIFHTFYYLIILVLHCFYPHTCKEVLCSNWNEHIITNCRWIKRLSIMILVIIFIQDTDWLQVIYKCALLNLHWRKVSPVLVWLLLNKNNRMKALWFT